MVETIKQVQGSSTSSFVVVIVLAIVLLSVSIIAVATNTASLTPFVNKSQTVVMISFNVSNKSVGPSTAAGLTLTSIKINNTLAPIAAVARGNAFNFTNITITNGTHWFWNSSFVSQGFPVIITIGKEIRQNKTGQNWTMRFVTNASI